MFLERLTQHFHRLRQSAFLVGLLSLAWFALRTGTKPSRAVYPCQRTAAINSYMWLTVYLVPFVSVVSGKVSSGLNKRIITIMFLIAVIVASAAFWGFSEMLWKEAQKEPSLVLNEGRATSQPASNIYVVNGTTGNDSGFASLIDLMDKNGLPFYESSEAGTARGPAGLIARDDVVIIKVNSQWDERGGTNTDLLKAVIQAIIEHPDGFIGEIVVADNGQAQYGSAPGGGGSLAYSRNNAENISQSAQDIVDHFAGSHRVSTYLWDTITTRRVSEYYEGDIEDGYVVNATVNANTGIMVSYPKFRTRFGTYVSFKLGIWNPQKQAYDSNRLKVINMPVLKSHSGYGVTACIKHYMGVVSDKLTSQLGARAHQTVGKGGMGTEMVETRFPVLNILDSIWVNAVPGRGPDTPYTVATRINVIAASTDPVALDYWAAKHILLQVARNKGYTGVNSIDPDNNASGSFGNWLRLSMQELTNSGYEATIDESRMNIYIANK